MRTGDGLDRRASTAAAAHYRLSDALRRAHGWLVNTPPGLVGLALVVGGGAGLGAVMFRYLILAITYLVTGSEDFSGAGRVTSTHLPWLGS